MRQISGQRLKEIMRFVVTGVLATAIHYGVYLLLLACGLGENVAFTIGYITSFVANYCLSARYTFRKRSSVGNLLGFATAHVVNYTLQMALLNAFILLGVGKHYAPMPVYCIAVPVNYLMVRFVFRHFTGGR